LNPERPLRVVLLGEYPHREDAIHEGGIQSVTHQLAHALARRSDVECFVVCASRGVATSERRVGALHVHFLSRPPLPRLATCRAYDVPRLVRRIRSLAPDVVHGQGQDRHGLAAVRSGLPAVITPHGVIRVESRFLRRNSLDLAGGIKRLLMDRNEAEVFRRAGDVILISEYLREVYGAELPARVHRIENPIDEAFFRVERRPEEGRLLFAGTVVPRKQVEDLVRALAVLTNEDSRKSDGRVRAGNGRVRAGDYARQAPWRLVIAGPLPDPALAGRIRALVSEAGLTDAVTLTGSLSQQELLREYARAEVLLLSSREETSPQVIAQAMACGLPVVASSVGGIPFMVTDRETALLFPFGRPEECAKRIRLLHGDGNLRASIAERARTEAAERFHPDKIAEMTVAVYREVASATPVRNPG
jgi:glycosyltransferase involved in cell wall biosynthesis